VRRAAKTDSNQAAVVQALRKAGASVYYIKEPVDLLVGYRNRSFLLEVKAVGGKLTESQKTFFRDYAGEAYIVHGVTDALAALQAR
jgi:hypothetical protein